MLLLTKLHESLAHEAIPRADAKPASFFARENIQRFLTLACSPAIGVPPARVFNVEDFVGKRNKRLP